MNQESANTKFLAEFRSGDMSDATFRKLLTEAIKCLRAVPYLCAKIRAADMESIAQDVVVEAWRSRHTYREEAKFGTWYRRIAIHTGHEYIRKQGGYTQRSTEPVLPTVSLEGLAHLSEDDGWLELPLPAPDDTARMAETRMLWKEGQGMLTSQERRIINLHRQGCSDQEIADEIDNGMTANAVCLARQRIRKKLSSLFEITLHEGAAKPHPVTVPVNNSHQERQMER